MNAFLDNTPDTLSPTLAISPSEPAAIFDVIVVGAGPAGSAAALSLAKKGRSVCLVERGPFAGSKNMYGGVIYGRILDELVPNWWDEIPVQRWITRRGTMLLTDHQSLCIDYRTTTWGKPPYNGFTAFRPDFDKWFADKAVAAGATLITSTTATGLTRNSRGVVNGITTDRGGTLQAKVVIACDGVNSFLAKEAGLYPHTGKEHFTLGVKEVLALPREEIESRFGVRGDEGADFEIVGGTRGIAGGAFVYTNRDTISVGAVLSLEGLSQAKIRPEEIIAGIKAHPSIAPLVEGGEVKEYAAHLIPEGGYNMMPTLYSDGLLISGDAAAMCLAAGLWLEGVNYAMGSGMAAAETAHESIALGDQSAQALRAYQTRMENSWVLQDHKKVRRAAHFLLSDRMQNRYPALACELMEQLYTVENPKRKRGAGTIARPLRKKYGISFRDLAKDGRDSASIFG
jgi:electron transfer flavoprotein-quinone oxidoreductase